MPGVLFRNPWREAGDCRIFVIIDMDQWLGLSQAS